MKLHIDLQYSDSLKTNMIFTPEKSQLRQWIKASLKQQDKRHLKNSLEISLRIVDEKESAQLNKQYRQKNKATNVLSFPSDVAEVIEPQPLGDLVICQAVVENEALQQGKKLESHWAHMIVHGCLHLLGYDHIETTEATEMEGLEVSILEKFKIPNPYH